MEVPRGGCEPITRSLTGDTMESSPRGDRARGPLYEIQGNSDVEIKDFCLLLY